MLKDHNSTYDLDISERPLRTRKKKLIALVGREVERMMINFFLFPFADPSVLKGAKSAKYTCERRTSDHGETIKESFEVQFS